VAEVRELTDEERAWVARMVDAAAAIADAYHLAPPPGQPMEPERLDTLWRSWLPDPGFAGQDPMLFINPFGLALGQWLVDRTGLEWRMATDERGTGVAIWGAAGEVLILPVDVVRKGFESRSAAFFVEVAQEVEEQVRASHEGPVASAAASEAAMAVERPPSEAEPGMAPVAADAEPAPAPAEGRVAADDEPTPDATESPSEPPKRTGLGRFFGRR
jgi:hypothetical protein